MALKKRYKFQLNTSTSCFLCLGEILDTSGSNSNSLHNVFQYLDIDLIKIKSLSTKPVELLNKTDVKVSLCDECRRTFKEISNLKKSMQVLNMKLEYNFELIQKRVKMSAFGKSNSKSDRNGDLEIGEEVSMRHSKLVKELREEIREKCESKMPNYQPRVQLNKVTRINKRVASPKPKTFSTANCKSMSEHHQFGLSDLIVEKTNSDFAPGQSSQELEYDDNQGITSNLNDSEMETDTDNNFNLIEEVCKMNSTASFGSVDSLALEKVLKTDNTFDISPSQDDERDENIEQSSKARSRRKNKKLRSVWHAVDPVTGTYNCKTCRKKYTCKSTFYFHYNTVHLQTKFKCKSCNKVYKYRCNLYNHRKTCLQNLEKMEDPRFKFGCDLCKKRFQKEKALYDHRRNVHESSYHCEVCNKKFTSSRYLKAHKDEAHFGKGVSCRFCGKRYGYMPNYKKHEISCGQRNTIKVENLSV